MKWYENKSLLEFLSDSGRKIRIRNLLRKSFVEERMTGLNFAEFSYQVMQAYDWLQLYERYGCKFQV